MNLGLRFKELLSASLELLRLFLICVSATGELFAQLNNMLL